MADDAHDDLDQQWVDMETGEEVEMVYEGPELGWGRKKRSGGPVTTGVTGHTSKQEFKLANYKLIRTTQPDNKTWKTVRRIDLNGKTIYNQPGVDVSIGYGVQPLNYKGQLNTNLLRSIKWSGARATNSHGHVYCFIRTDGGGKISGRSIQECRFPYKYWWPNNQPVRGGNWMTGRQDGYFGSYKGKEGHDDSKCGKYPNHCQNALTGWIPVTSRFAGYSNQWANIWFSSWRLHDGNGRTTMTIKVEPGEYAWLSGETQHTMTMTLS